MISLFQIGFIELTLLDIIDIFIVAILLYRVLLIIRGTRALSMVLGLFVVLLLAFLSSWLEMDTLNWIVGKLGAVWIIAFIVVFQPEIRNILTTIGHSPIFRRIVPTEQEEYLDALIRALRTLKNAKIGALIVIKRDVGLKNIEANGKSINAKLTPELLVTIFAPHTPLHDGAVIIEKGLIISAACQLPMTHNPKYQMDIGMRHRAGIGLSEETDAVSIIVSEETGAVSMALRGHLRKDLNFDTLRKLLEVVISNKG